MSLTYGELFAGYDGLGMGIRSVLGGTTSWFAEYDPAPSKILAHHYPDIPNLGDVTKIDWTQVEPVDVITGGSPCQDVSHAGKRAGMRPGTRSGLWASMADAIDIIRPRLVVWENVRGALSADADSALEYCPGCVGDPDDGTVLRALGRVLGDLADIGYDTRWYGLRAADVGAAHERFRIFLFATPADSDLSGLQECRHQGGVRAAQAGASPAVDGGRGERSPLTLLPTPAASQGDTLRESEGFNDLGRVVGALLPTPAVNDMGEGKDVDAWDAWTDRMRAEHGNGNGHGSGQYREAMANALQDWAQYEAAIRRAEHALGRPAPAPTEVGAKGNLRLSPRFVEWLMMLPEGHVTDVGLSRNDELKALGNGVVPAQAAAACRAWLNDTRAEAAS